MKNGDIIFKDREEAGEKLVPFLEKYKNQNAVVFGLPRGGVVPAATIAKALNAPLDLVIVKKIGHQFNPEYAVGAIAEDGEIILNPDEKDSIDSDWLKTESETQITEIKRRRSVYLKNTPQKSIKNKIAIIVDDGVATGLTMLVAIKFIKKQKPKKIIVAVPVIPKDTVKTISENIDELIAIESPKYFMGAVGNYYEQFEQLTDQDVINYLKDFTK